MYLYFDNTGKLLKNLIHGYPARSGSREFEVFAYFDTNKTFSSVSMRLVNPDGVEIMTEPVQLEPKEVEFKLTDYETVESIQPFERKTGPGYVGFYYSFKDSEQFLLNTPGLWKAYITAYDSDEKEAVQGVVTFVCQDGPTYETTEDYTVEDALNDVLRVLSTKLNIKNIVGNRVIRYFGSDEPISDKETLDTGIYTSGDIIFDQSSKTLYQIDFTDLETGAFEKTEIVNLSKVVYREDLIIVVDDIPTDLSQYEEGQMFFVRADKSFRKLVENQLKITSNNIITVEKLSDLDNLQPIEAGQIIFVYGEEDVNQDGKRFLKWNGTTLSPVFDLTAEINAAINIAKSYTDEQVKKYGSHKVFKDKDGNNFDTEEELLSAEVYYRADGEPHELDPNDFAIVNDYQGHPAKFSWDEEWIFDFTLGEDNKEVHIGSLSPVNGEAIWIDTDEDYPLLSYEIQNNKVQNINALSTEAQYPSAKAVYNAVEATKRIAMGQCKCAVISYENETIADIKSYLESKVGVADAKAVYVTPEHKEIDIKVEIISGKFDNFTIVNDLFDNSDDSITIPTGQTCLVRKVLTTPQYGEFSEYTYEFYFVNPGIVIGLNLTSFFEKEGDVVIVRETNVPDRWVEIVWSGSGIMAHKTYIFNKLETKLNLDELSKATNLENGTGVSSLQQIAETETWTGIDENGEGVARTSGATGEYSVAIGSKSLAEGKGSLAGGTKSYAGKYAVAIGDTVFAKNFGVATGFKTIASGDYSHAEGSQSVASAESSHAEGIKTKASEAYSHAEGSETEAKGNSSHAEGIKTIAENAASHAEGNETLSKYGSHAEGYKTEATGNNSHAEGCLTRVLSDIEYPDEDSNPDIPSIPDMPEESGDAQNPEQWDIPNGYYAHAEGYKTVALGAASHAEGNTTQSIGKYSHAQGELSNARHKSSFVSGTGLNTSTDSQTVLGTFNKDDSNALLIVGNGNGTPNNAFSINKDGSGCIEKVNEKDKSIINVKYLKGLNYPQTIGPDITNLDLNQIYDYSFTEVKGGRNTPDAGNAGVLLTLPYRQPKGNTKPDFGVQIYATNGDDPNGKNIYFRTSMADTWDIWQTFATKAYVDAHSGGSTDTTRSTIAFATDDEVEAIFGQGE